MLLCAWVLFLVNIEICSSGVLLVPFLKASEHRLAFDDSSLIPVGTIDDNASYFGYKIFEAAFGRMAKLARRLIIDCVDSMMPLP